MGSGVLRPLRHLRPDSFGLVCYGLVLLPRLPSLAAAKQASRGESSQEIPPEGEKAKTWRGWVGGWVDGGVGKSADSFCKRRRF